PPLYPLAATRRHLASALFPYTTLFRSKALVEALCFGSRKIVERLKEEGVSIDAVIAMGGVAKKSSLVMQTMADVLNMPIKVATRSEEHTSELQSRENLVCRLLLEKKKD